jgi:uncharacterized membrane protein (UPF0127 family)
MWMQTTRMYLEFLFIQLDNATMVASHGLLLKGDCYLFCFHRLS